MPSRKTRAAPRAAPLRGRFRWWVGMARNPCSSTHAVGLTRWWPQARACCRQPLEEADRGRMGALFGHNFSRVRVHSDAGAAASARAHWAQAYTFGNHLVFGEGHYARALEGLTLAHP